MQHPILACLVACAACFATPPAEKGYTVVKDTLESPALAKNRMGARSKVKVSVFLPASYHVEPTRRFPVVYFISSYQEPDFPTSNRPGSLTGYMPAALESAMGSQGMREFILVEPSDTNPLTTTFFVNSAAVGAYEDYVTQDLVAFIDGKYRTLPEAASRGLAGQASSGMSALNIALRHPQVFSAVFALSPTLLAPQAPDKKTGTFDRKTLSSWDSSFRTAYGAFYSPDLNLKAPHARIPQFDGSEADNKVIQDWEQGMGQFPEKIKAYQARTEKLTQIGLLVGEKGKFPRFVEGAKTFAQALQEAGISHSLRFYDGDRDQPMAFIDNHFVPFFSSHLKAQ